MTPDPKWPASAEVALYHRATIDIWTVYFAARYLQRRRPELLMSRAYDELGEALFTTPGLIEKLRPADDPLGDPFLMSIIQTGLVVTYARPFTGGKGNRYPLSSKLVPRDTELRETHAELVRLRKKVYAHIDDVDPPFPTGAERFQAVDDDGVERQRFQGTGVPQFIEAQLRRIERLALAVGRNIDERLRIAKRSELASVGRCSECGRAPRPDENAEDEWRAGSDGVGGLHVFCPECWEREFVDS